MSDSNSIAKKTSCYSPDSGCCDTTNVESGSGKQPPRGLTRRQFLTRTGAASVAMLFAGLPRWAAGSGEVRLSEHLIPKEKNLPAGWLKSLTEKVDGEVWSGSQLNTVGMPAGGIGAGQIYFCGDGSLGLWEIFNEHHVPNHGLDSYVRRTIPKPVQHGLALYYKSNGKTNARMLDETGFSSVGFRNTHPIATVTYSDSECPLKVMLEGFSPFIPLNAKDSALPVTMMVVTVENTSDNAMEVGTASWLENPIGRRAREYWFEGRRSNQITSDGRSGRITHTANGHVPTLNREARDTVVFQDFEGTDFGAWKIEGDAFGNSPTTGNLPTQQNVTGWEGKGFAGSFRNRDATTGKLISPEFEVSHRYINFKIGGGNQPGNQGINLVIDGNVVRKGSANNDEALNWNSWDVSEFEGKKAHLEIVDNSTDGWGHTQVDHIEFSDERRPGAGPVSFDKLPDAGTLSWGVMEELLSPDAASQILKLLGDKADNIITENTIKDYALDESHISGIATKSVTIKPGNKQSFVHILAWHFPNTVNPSAEAGHYYASLFKDSNAVLDYAIEHKDRLINDTRNWRDTYYDSTLPTWLLDRVHMTSSCLATGTAMWWESGRFWAFEGVTCCNGTCTHVYNYVQTISRLFPELERNLREKQDLKPGVGLEPSGLVGFRHDGKYAADGQCGTILKVYREHQMSADDAFLKRNWTNTKLALDYAIGQDGNGDGIMEGSQHNTYDVNFYGPNTFVGALYLAALRAGEEMALELGEKDYADKLHIIFENGKKFTEEVLWNGEYFFQKVNLKEHDHHQYDSGCLSDQLFGQNWAHQLNLGYLYDPVKVSRALKSVWEYNWAPDLGTYNKVYPAQRIFAEAAEAGLFNCTWPHSEHLENSVLYRDEVWSGVEYQVANHMIYEGMMTEGLAMCRAIHDRYSPSRRNPYNEIECSDYYSRAMASWGMILALSGFTCHGPKGEYGFNPRITPDNFRCVFNGPEGWGTFEQQGSGAQRTWSLFVKSGEVKMQTLTLSGDKIESGVSVSIDGKNVAEVSHEFVNDQLRISFPDEILLSLDQKLMINYS